MLRRFGALALFAVLLLFFMPLRAEAHAGLLRSVPAVGETRPTAPAAIELEFNEDLDPSFSTVQLFDSQNMLINPGPGAIDPANPRVLRLPLDGLPNGSYTAIFTLRSSLDGHTTSGGIPFGVGVAAVTTSLLPPPGTPEPATQLPAPQDALARWLNYAFVAAALGGLPFAIVVWRPVYARWRAAKARLEQDHADSAVTRFIRRLVLVGGALFIAANLFFLLTQAAVAADVPLVAAFGAPLVKLLGTRTGVLVIVRITLMLILMALTPQLHHAGTGGVRRWWLAAALGGAVLLTISLNSHGASSTQPWVAVPMDWLHLVAMVAWLGGLLPLVAAIWLARGVSERGIVLRDLVPRFSRLALVAVGVLVVTGSYSAWLHIGRLDLIDRTTYGQAFALKLAGFGLLIWLGGRNLLRHTRQLRATGNHAARPLGRTVVIELIIGALVLLAVGGMTSVAPSTTAWAEQERLGIAKTATSADVAMTLRVAPAVIGDNELAVDITDTRPGAAGKPAKVFFTFGMVGMDMGELKTDATANGGERYVTRGSYLSMGGRWQIGVTLRRVGFADITQTFDMDIVRAAPPPL